MKKTAAIRIFDAKQPAAETDILLLTLQADGESETNPD